MARSATASACAKRPKAANSSAKLSWTAALAGASSAALAMRTNASSKRPWSRIASPSAHEIAGLQTGELRPFLDDLKRTFARLGHTERMRQAAKVPAAGGDGRGGPK